MEFPDTRPRRLRQNASIRALVQENWLTPNDLLAPVFVMQGKGLKEEISSMPNYFRFSIDLAVKEVKELYSMGIKGVMLFVKVADKLKDNAGTEAINPRGLMQTAITEIKDACPEMLVFSDVAMDPYSSLGHDGIVQDGKILNDDTCEILGEMAITHAQAGADFIAPSDMMDGRIGFIREVLDEEGYEDTGILAYSAKYASCFYGPFRDALDSAPVDVKNVPTDKKTYQMNPGNSKVALQEMELDISEGADIIMVKPALSYLDIISIAKQNFNTPIAAYQVSGEYSMIHAAAQKGWLDYDSTVLETTLSIKRAGADMIATYFTRDLIRLID
jgi:porphobilinogen synthase